MLYALLKTVHLLSVIVWVGGMFFPLFCLSHAVLALPAAQRVPVMSIALGRFFQAVGAAAVLALASGAAMMSRAAHVAHQLGAPFNVPLEWLVMAGLGVLMALVFGHIRFALFKRLGRAEALRDWTVASEALRSIRGWVAINFVTGVLIVVVVMAGTMN